MYAEFGVGAAVMVTANGPVQVGALQDAELHIKWAKKKLYGAFQFPLRVARGEGEVTWKAKGGFFSGAAIATILAGSVTTAGTVVPIVSEPHQIPSGTPYTVVVGANSIDLGVYDNLSGILMTPVASGSEATGKYSFAPLTGTYTFALADAGKAIQITATKADAVNGHNSVYSNQLMGATMPIVLYFTNPNPMDQKAITFKVHASVIDGFDLVGKNSEFRLTDLGGEGFADANNTILTAYYAD